MPDSREPLRIALLSIHSSPLARVGSGYAGGMNVYVRRLADGLARCGVRVDMFTRRTDPAAAEIVTTEAGARLIYLDAGPARALPRSVIPLHVPAAVESMRAFMRRERVEYDVLHSHYWISGLVASRVRDDARVPFIHMFHTLSKVKEFYCERPDPMDSALRPDGERCVINHADVIVGAIPSERDEIEGLYGRSPSEFAVIPPGVEIDLFRPQHRTTARHTLGISGERVVLFVGRLDRIKGLDVLLESFADVSRARKDDLRLVVLGHDPRAEHRELAFYQRTAARLGIAERVVFRGNVPQDQLPAYYSAADLLAVPSAYESFGMAAVESMACGTPVVGFNVGGLSATIRDGQTGFLARPGSRRDFTLALERALGSPDLECMGRQARLAVQRYSWESMTERTLALYEALIRRSFKSRHLVGAV